MKETAGVTVTEAGLEGVTWNVVGQIYKPKLHSDNAMLWSALVPADTFVPPHVHPLQDEWILVTGGQMEVDFGFEDGKVTAHKAGPGDLIRMPMGVAHGVYNRSGAEATCVFGVAPARKLYDLFYALDGVTDPQELVRLSALHEVDFLPPPPDA